MKDLKAVKAEAKKEFSHIRGILGFGLGEDSLRIYVLNSEVKKQLPHVFHDVPIDCVVTGDVVAI